MKYNEIMDAVRRQHERVEGMGYTVVFTSLIGSQNYRLDDESSDIDTFSLILPPFEDIAFAREPISSEFEVEDGKCMYKDIRLALNLLKKASPNSTEMFASLFIYINPEFGDVVGQYMRESNLNKMLHSNYSHMLYSCIGMAYQLVKRNMPAGKRYAHALRLLELVKNYCAYSPSFHLFWLPESVRHEALAAKRNMLEKKDEWYNTQCISIAEQLEGYEEVFEMTNEQETIEKEGKALIEEFQINLMKKYLGVKE